MNSRLSQWSLGVYPSKTSVWKFYNLRQMFSGKYRLIGRLRLVSMMAKARYVSEAENKQVRNSTYLNGYRSTPFELYIAVNWWIIWIIPDRASGMLSVYSIVTNLFYLGQLRGKCKPLLAISTAVKNVIYIHTRL